MSVRKSSASYPLEPDEFKQLVRETGVCAGDTDEMILAYTYLHHAYDKSMSDCNYLLSEDIPALTEEIEQLTKTVEHHEEHIVDLQDLLAEMSKTKKAELKRAKSKSR